MQQRTANQAVFADFLAWAGRKQHVRSSNPQVKARIQSGEGGMYLWIANPTRSAQPVNLELSAAWAFTSLQACSESTAEATVDGQTVQLTAPARDVVVFELMG